MPVKDLYYNKYLKYKNKYLYLQSQMGGSPHPPPPPLRALPTASDVPRDSPRDSSRASTVIPHYALPRDPAPRERSLSPRAPSHRATSHRAPPSTPRVSPRALSNRATYPSASSNRARAPATAPVVAPDPATTPAVALPGGLPDAPAPAPAPAVATAVAPTTVTTPVTELLNDTFFTDLFKSIDDYKPTRKELAIVLIRSMVLKDSNYKDILLTKIKDLPVDIRYHLYRRIDNNAINRDKVIKDVQIDPFIITNLYDLITALKDNIEPLEYGKLIHTIKSGWVEKRSNQPNIKLDSEPVLISTPTPTHVVDPVVDPIASAVDPDYNLTQSELRKQFPVENENYDDYNEDWGPFQKPTEPRSVKAVAGNTKATVIWIRPIYNGTLSIKKYIITSSPGNIQKEVTVKQYPPDDKYQLKWKTDVEGLTNDISYTFTVVARNHDIDAFGLSLPSSPSNPVIPSSSL